LRGIPVLKGKSGSPRKNFHSWSNSSFSRKGCGLAALTGRATPATDRFTERFFGSYTILAERIGTITTFAVHEIVKIRRPEGTSQVLATNADKCASEVGRSRMSRLIRQDARIQWTGQPGPLAAFDAVRK
jgi:hypothetical protein